MQISKIFAAGLRLSTPPHLWLFDFSHTLVKSLNWKRRHIGIQISIRIIYYPVDGYPDSKLSVLRISTKTVQTNLESGNFHSITWLASWRHNGYHLPPVMVWAAWTLSSDTLVLKVAYLLQLIRRSVSRQVQNLRCRCRLQRHWHWCCSRPGRSYHCQAWLLPFAHRTFHSITSLHLYHQNKSLTDTYEQQ